MIDRSTREFVTPELATTVWTALPKKSPLWALLIEWFCWDNRMADQIVQTLGSSVGQWPGQFFVDVLSYCHRHHSRKEQPDFSRCPFVKDPCVAHGHANGERCAKRKKSALNS